MLKFAVLAVAATISAPGYGASVHEADVDRLARSGADRALAFQTLVAQTWVRGEAKERGIVVSDKEVEATIRGSRTPKELRRYLRNTGMTRTLLRKRVRATIEMSHIAGQVTEPAAKSVTPDQVKAHVDANPKVLPESRTVRLVRMKNRTQARRIKARLERGATWASVGGYRDELTRDRDPVTRAIFRAKVNRLTRYGRAVFEVLAHTPERPMPRAQQEALAWEELSSQAQQHALDVFMAQFTEKWRVRTACAPAYARHPSCAPPTKAQDAP